jgi:hypothetical protein
LSKLLGVKTGEAECCPGPAITVDALALVNSVLPSAQKSETEAKTGQQSTSVVSPSCITALNERAAEWNNQLI